MKRDEYYQEIVNNLYMFQLEDLFCLKHFIEKKDIFVLDELLNEAIEYGICSVTQKKNKAPSQNIHDYMSCSIYHWPNPNTESGLPYIERDGVDNPEAIHGDKESLRTLTYITYLSSILYFITEQNHYMDIIVKYNRYWFLDEETKMNPNLRYAQCIPGVNDGEPGGIIDYAASYGYALNLLRLLKKCNLLANDFYESMSRWHKDFYDWLLTSDQGKIEGKRENNQGSLYDLLLLNIAKFINCADKNYLDKHYEQLLRRIEFQINAYGLLPLELGRTKTKSYTTMGLKMLLETAYLLQEEGYDFTRQDKLYKALNYVKPHYINHTWDFMQIKAFDSYRGYYILFLFKKVLKEKCDIVFEKKENHWGYILLKKLYEEEDKMKGLVRNYGELKVHISSTRKEMGIAAGKRIEGIIREAILKKGEARVIFASAPSQNEMLEYLKTASIDWSKVVGFHMDEYVGIDKNAPQSFSKFLEDRLVHHVPMGKWYPFGGTTPSVQEDLALYTKLLNEKPIDLVILGIGENGHLAFNDPAYCDFNDPLTVKVVSLDEVCRNQQVNDGCFERLDLVPKDALTITIPPLLKCEKKVAVVPGPTKKYAIQNTLLGKITEECPASILRKTPNSELFVDFDSYGLVEELS